MCVHLYLDCMICHGRYTLLWPFQTLCVVLVIFLLASRMDVDVARFGCTQVGCSSVFCSKRSLREHLDKHMGIKRYGCSVGGCGRRFRCPSNLRTHMKRQHDLLGGCRRYECDKCKRVFRCRQNLQVHQQRHTGIKPFPCRKCDRALCSQQSRRNHEWVKHGLGEQFNEQ